jgi:hypothetical protein
VRFNISACFLSSVGFLSKHQSGPAEFLFSRSQGVCPSARCVFRICLQFCARTAERLGPVPTHLRFSWCSSLECSAPLLSVVSPNASFDFSVWGWSAPGWVTVLRPGNPFIPSFILRCLTFRCPRDRTTPNSCTPVSLHTSVQPLC